MLVTWTLLALACSWVADGEDEDNVVVAANSRFASALFSATVLSPAGGGGANNELFSPIALHVLFSLLYVGARGEAARRLATLLCLPNDRERVKEGYRELLSSELLAATLTNKIFLSSEIVVDREFEDSAVEVFRASVDHVDFTDEYDAELADVSVAEMSRGKLTKLNLNNHFADSTRKALFLGGAYFREEWLYKFDVATTRNISFRVTPKKAVTVPTMSKLGKFRMTTDRKLRAHILQLPYTGREGPSSFVVLLPLDEKDGTRVLERNLRNRSLTRVSDLSTVPPDWLRVHLPRMDVSESRGLEARLNALGLQSALELDKEMYAGLSSEGVDRSYVLHNADFEVDEEGSVASFAALQDVIDTRDGDGPPPIRPDQLYVNRPFLFLVRCETTGTILFLGKYAHP